MGFTSEFKYEDVMVHTYLKSHAIGAQVPWLPGLYSETLS